MSDNIDIQKAIRQIRTVLAENPNTATLSADEVEPLVQRSIVTGNITVQNGNLIVGDHNYIINIALEQIRIRAVEHPVPPIDHVVGRERELSELALQMGDGPTTNIVSAAHSTAVFGVAGIGKSTLATLYYHRFRDHYTQVYWRDLSKDPLISGLVHAFADILGEHFDPREVPNEENQALLLVGWLRKLPEPYLIVLDDCEIVLNEEGNAQPGWETLFEQDSLGKCKLLLTSRQHIKAGRKRVHNYQIEGLNLADGLALLHEWGLVDVDEELLKQAVTKSSGHPLALILLAQLVVEDHLVLTDLLAERRLWEKEVAHNLLDEVYKRLSERQKLLIRYVSLYDRPPYFRRPVSPSDVAGMLLRYHWTPIVEKWKSEEPYNNPQAREDWLARKPKPRSELDWRPATIQDYALELSRRALLNSEAGRYTMHAIVRDYAYELIPETECPFYHRAAAAYFRSLYTRDPHTNPPKDVSDIQPLLDTFDQLYIAGEFQQAANVLVGTPMEYLSGGDWVALHDLLSRWGEYIRQLAMDERIVNSPADALEASFRAAATSNLGMVYYSLGKYDQATQYHSQRLALAEQRGDRQGQASSLAGIGNVYLSLGEYRRALAYHTHSLTIKEQLGDEQGQANSLGNLGLIYSHLDDYNKAIEYHSRSLALDEKLGNQRGQAQTIGNLGNVYCLLGEYDKAIEYHQRALKIAEQLGDRADQASTLGNLAVAYEQMGKYDQAMICNQQARSIFAQLDLTQSVVQVDQNIASVQQKAGWASTGDDDHARNADNEDRCEYLTRRGRASRKGGDYQQAISYFEQALAIAEQIGNADQKSGLLTKLGNTYSDMDDYERAIDYHKQALTLHEQIGDTRGRGISLGNIGGELGNMGRQGEAVSYFEQSLAIAEQVGDREGQYIRLDNLGNAYDDMGDYSHAISYFERALALAEQIEDLTWQAESLSNIGHTYKALADYPKVIEYHKRAIATASKVGDHRIKVNSYGTIGNAYWSLDDYPTAIQYYTQALEAARLIGDLSGQGHALGNIGTAYGEMGQTQTAISYLQQAHTIFESINAANLVAWADNEISVARRLAGNVP